MRSIKFKVISKSTGKAVCAYQLGLTFVPDTGQLYQGSMNVSDAYSLCQFTGLLDKEGVEIYEGDIVKQTRRDNCFGDGYYVEICAICEPEYYELGDQELGGPDGSCPIIEMEIIGNIYENPELLKGEK